MPVSKDTRVRVDDFSKIIANGLMIGIELTIPCGGLVDLCLESKLLINVTADQVIRLLPPLIIEQAHADTIVEIVVSCVHKFTESYKK